MGSGNCDWGIVVAHDLTKQFRTCKHGETLFLRTGEFRIVRMYGCGVDNNFYVVCNIGSTLSVINPGTFFLKGLCQRAGFGIGTGNPEIFFQKDLGKAAHADASDPDEMNMERFMKVYLIHNNLLI